MLKRPSTLILAASLAAFSRADPIDLSGWTPVTLDFPGGQRAANWTLQPGNESVIQTANSDPSFFLNNADQTNYSIDGSWRVNTTADDDYMGFVFGYENTSNFYLFDWKQGSQGYNGASAAEGMTIKKFTGPTGDGLDDLSLGQLWENETDFENMTILGQNHGSDKGWASNTFYDFHLDFNLVAEQFSIVVREGETELWNVTLSDNTFTSGQFGFYNYSQSQVEYNGFTQTDGPPPVIDPPVNPDPPSTAVSDGGSTLAILSAALASLTLFSRRRRLFAAS